MYLNPCDQLQHRDTGMSSSDLQAIGAYERDKIWPISPKQYECCLLAIPIKETIQSSNNTCMNYMVHLILHMNDTSLASYNVRHASKTQGPKESVSWLWNGWQLAIPLV